MVVRNESVRLSLDDDFTTKMARAAAITAVMRKELDSLDGSSVKATKSIGPLGNDIDRTGRSSAQASNEIDKLSGRLRLAADAALILGPALGPLGAAAVGGVVALSAQVGALAGGLGVTILAVKGLGDGLKALDAYQLDRSAANLEKLNQEMEKLGPAGEGFVRFLDSIEPNLKTLQNAAREGLLPGAQEGIEALIQRLPELRKLIRGMAEGLGDLSADAGKALAGERWDAFFKYLRTDGIKLLDETSRTVGHLAETVANLFVAFGGVSADFSGGLLEFSQGLAEASANLESNTGFQEFVDYISTQGPHALETLGALANMFLQIVEAAAPLGGPVLTGLTAMANIISTIADSDIGTPIFIGLAAMALFNRSVQVTQKLTAMTFGGPGVAAVKSYAAALGTVVTAQDRATMSAKELAAAEKTRDTAQAGLVKGTGRAALAGAGLAIAMSGVGDSVGYANTAMLAVAGPWGAAAGFALDLWNATDRVEASIAGLSAAMESGNLTAITTEIAAAQKKLDEMDKDRQSLSFKESLLGPLAPLTDNEFSLSDITGKTDELSGVLADAVIQAQALAAAEGDVAGQAGATTGAMFPLRQAAEAAAEAEERQTEAILGAVDAMRAKRQEALRGVNAELNYQQALDDARAALKENGKTVDETTDKGRANLRALYAIAGGWNELSDGAKNAKGALHNSRQAFLDMADDMGMNEDKAKRLADRLYEIPTKRRTEVGLDGVDNAINKAEGLKAILDKLHDKNINIALHYQTIGNKPKAPTPGGEPSADGGTVPRSGRPYADRYPYLLADAEEVTSNRYGQADHFRPFLKAINAWRPGMADGGTAGLAANTYTKRGGGYEMWHEVGAAAHGAAGGLRGLHAQLNITQHALDRSEKALDRETGKRDEIANAMASLAGTVSSGLRSDIFAAPSSPWAGSLGGVAGANAALQGDINQGQEFSTLVTAIQGRGLHGSALQALLEQAAQNHDTGLLQQFAGASASDVANYQSLFDIRDQVLSGVGTMTGQAVFGDAYAERNKVLEQTRDETKGLRQDVREVKQAIKELDEHNKQGHQGTQAAAASGSSGGFHTVGGGRRDVGPR